MDFVAIDFETANNSRDSACALAIVKVINNSITERHSWVFQPPRNEYAPQCINVHGITPEMTVNLGDIATIHNRIIELLDGAVVVAHNAAFDLSVLESSLATAGLPMPNISETHCSCKLSGNKRLEECCKEYNIPLDHHDPLSDAVACAKVFLKLQGKSITPIVSSSPWGDPNRKVKSETLMPPDLSTIENKDTIFYGQKVVITGVMQRYSVREELAMMLKGYGADIQTSISVRTNIVICGAGAGPSKMKKIDDINSKGGNISVMDECMFCDCIDKIQG